MESASNGPQSSKNHPAAESTTSSPKKRPIPKSTDTSAKRIKHTTATTAATTVKSSEFKFTLPGGEDLLPPAATEACRMLLAWTESSEAKDETKSIEKAANMESSNGSSKSIPVRRSATPTTPESMLNMIQSRLQMELKLRESAPPIYMHWSPKDAATQMKFFEDKEVVQRDDSALLKEYLQEVGGEKGYHMVRGSRGVSEGSWYYEVEVINGNSVMTVDNDRPTRIGPDVVRSAPGGSSTQINARNASTPDDPHLRIGFAMRTGDLQAPVGFDKWSYGYRDSAGSKIHKSMRVDDWGGESYKPGDIVGFGITLNEKEKSIRFFKNGVPQGKGMCVAFQLEGDEDRFYYPAFSCFGGGRGRANFGPDFIYPPNQKFGYKPFTDLVVAGDMEAAEEKLNVAVKKFKNFKVKQVEGTEGVLGGEMGGQTLLRKDPHEVVKLVAEIMSLKWNKIRLEDFVAYNKKAFRAMKERAKTRRG